MLSPRQKPFEAPPTSPLKWTPQLLKDSTPLDLPFSDNLQRSFARSRSEANLKLTHWETDDESVWPQGQDWKEPIQNFTYVQPFELHPQDAMDFQQSPVLFQQTPSLFQQDNQQSKMRKRSNEDFQMDSQCTLMEVPFTSASTWSSQTLNSPTSVLGSNESSMTSIEQPITQQSLKRVKMDDFLRKRSNSLPNVPV
jgi:hypothetical protein